MHYRLEKNLKIMDELVIYCVKHGGRNIDLNITFAEEFSLFSLTAEVDAIPQSDIDRISQMLNEERQYEIEENYWMLGGDSELQGESEMFLVGIMIDEATVTCSNGRLTIRAKRMEKNGD